MKKYSVRIDGHHTSVTLEEAFWEELCRLAKEQNLPVSALITEIDRTRDNNNLSGALRLYVLTCLQDKISALSKS